MGRSVDSERLWSRVEELGLLMELLNFQVEIPTLIRSNSQVGFSTGGRSSISLVKLIFTKTHFTKGMLDFVLQKLRLRWIGLMEFNFLKTQTYLHEICHLFMIHLQKNAFLFQMKSKISQTRLSF